MRKGGSRTSSSQCERVAIAADKRRDLGWDRVFCPGTGVDDLLPRGVSRLTLVAKSTVNRRFPLPKRVGSTIRPMREPLPGPDRLPTHVLRDAPRQHHGANATYPITDIGMAAAAR